MSIFKKLLFTILLVFITSSLTVANPEEEKDVEKDCEERAIRRTIKAW